MIIGIVWNYIEIEICYGEERWELKRNSRDESVKRETEQSIEKKGRREVFYICTLVICWLYAVEIQ